MIEPGWVRMMAAYNSESNRRTYRAAATLDDAERRADRGAFFGSIHATLNHLVWADRMWMGRFAGWEKPAVSIPGSTSLYEGWEELRAAREEFDLRIEGWAAGLVQADLEGDLVWYSASAGAEQRKPRWFTVCHMFNHQTHHRGQVHALLTRAGASVAATDLPWVVEAAWERGSHFPTNPM
ncbi:DinB family protein [Roseococcus sp. YIM B11640]|uniref:DinB family protein n=1 Tax=Roseococcus sp. YIM B11640 TaxID=3133973 RepID=UPI003C7AB7EB